MIWKMKQKVCSKCDKTKSEKEFNRLSASKDGLQAWCRECGNLYKRVYYKKNREKLLDYAKDYNEENSKMRKEYMQEWRKTNAKHVREYNQQWIDNNKEHVKKRYNKYRKKRYREDIQFKLAYNLRSRLRTALKGKRKDKQTLYYLDCSVEYLINYLKERFESGMSWENYGKKWHIDHIVPLSSFDLTKKEQIEKACHYTNLQPLWAEDNFKKGNKNDNEIE